MNSEQMNTIPTPEVPDEAWDIFLPDGEDETLPVEGDFWFDTSDDED